jgi:hypothetical protein
MSKCKSSNCATEGCATGETTQTATDSPPLFSSPEKLRSDSEHHQPSTSVFAKVKQMLQNNRTVVISDEDEEKQRQPPPANEWWQVRHYKAKAPFVIPHVHVWSGKDLIRPTTTYYVCEEQVKRAKMPGRFFNRPHEIRPSFVRKRKRTTKLSSPANKTRRQEDALRHWINPAPSVDTPPNAQPPQLSVNNEEESSGDEDLPSLKDIFEGTGGDVQPTPPPTPPAPVITEDAGCFRCQFKSETVQFQLYIKK